MSSNYLGSFVSVLLHTFAVPSLVPCEILPSAVHELALVSSCRPYIAKTRPHCRNRIVRWKYALPCLGNDGINSVVSRLLYSHICAEKGR